MAANRRPDDPTLEQVEQFFQRHLVARYGIPMPQITQPPPSIKATAYQIIRGQVSLKKHDMLPDKIRESINDLPMFKTLMPEDFLEISIKGHGGKKKIYCILDPGTVLYCPEAGFYNANNPGKEPDNFSENWFASDESFFFYHERKHKCIQKKFYEFKQIERFARADEPASRDCNRIGSW